MREPITEHPGSYHSILQRANLDCSKLNTFSISPLPAPRQ